MGRDYEFTAFAFETLTVGSGNVSTPLSKTKYDPDSGGLPARMAMVVVSTTGLIRYIYGGVTVSSATGHVAAPFDKIELYGNQQIRDFRTTAVTSGTAMQVTVTYFR